MNERRIALLWMGALAMACGDPLPGATGGDDAGNPTSDNPPDPSDTNTPPATGGATGTGSPASSGQADSDTGNPADADSGPPPIDFDLGIIPDAPEFCTQGDGEVQYSYIWVANSSQSTISKINTQTLTEEGRYITRQDQQGSPSRTSVGLSGDVVTANRSGGITKFYANLDDCVDSNGNGIIDTSSGPNDLEPWGSEECMAWHIPMNYTSQRPVAWTQGEFDKAACQTTNEKVWTSGASGNAIEVLLVDGDTGVVEETIPIPGVSAGFFGIYGAAVDSEGNFWGSQLGGGTLVNVNLQTLAIDTWPTPAGGYGMTVDQDGFVWTCSFQVGRFDPMTETWQTAQAGGNGGCMADGGDILWLANNPMIGINRHTLVVEHSINLPNYVHGVSVDFEGFVWGVSQGTDAYRVDPVTGNIDTVGGLVSPYTYSDMTGFALNNVGNGGGARG